MSGFTGNVARINPAAQTAPANSQVGSAIVPAYQDILDEKIESALLTYCRSAQNTVFQQVAGRQYMMEIDRQYMREKDWTQENLRARNANFSGDATKFQDAVVPIVMPQVESGLEYLCNVFLTGYPIFGVATAPDTADQALQMETIIAENTISARWSREFIMAFRDGLKYNICAVELEWATKTAYNVQDDATAATGSKLESVLWKGNKLKRLDLYNTFWDMRVAPADVHEKGDYVGYNELLTRVQFKQRVNDLFGKVRPSVIERALKSQMASVDGTTSSNGQFGYFIPVLNPWPFRNQNASFGIDWMAWVNDEAYTNSVHPEYKQHYLWTVMYLRLLPSDFGLKGPGQNTPQIWKFIFVNGQVCLFAERQSNAHNFIPCFFCQPNEDGLNYQTKSYASNVSDLQYLATALMRGFVDARRRSVTDRVLFDPSQILAKDINSPNPSAKIPVRPAAYGQPLERAVYAFPYRDTESSAMLTGVQQVTAMADMVNSQNKAQQGQFVKGNRTKTEYNDIIGHSNDRNQVIAIEFEAQMMTPLKEGIKLNILQFQEPATVNSPKNGQQVEVNPTTLRQKAVVFKVSDGMLPTEKIISENDLQQALQAMAQSPQIGAAFNIGPMFAYLLEQRGADVKPFIKPPEQMQYEQAMGAWQQAAAEAAKAGTAFSTPQPVAPKMPAGPGQAAPGQPQSTAPGAGTTAALQSTQGS